MAETDAEVEAVARAICWERCHDFDGSGCRERSQCRDWDCETVLARAAIAALRKLDRERGRKTVPREATEEMVRQGEGYTDLVYPGENTDAARRAEIRVAWLEMWDAAEEPHDG